MEKRLQNIDLTPSQYRDVKALLKIHLPNIEVWAYGSRATFKARHSSDLDLVALAGKEQQSAVYRLKDAFTESDLPFSVDVLLWDTIPEHFKPNIRRGYYVLQEKNQKNALQGWEEVNLGDIADINTGKSNSQDAADNGAYPLFDRSMLIKKSNRYLFDCEAIIVPGEGKEFTPRYFSGKFDLHQRCYCITARNEKETNTQYLYYFLLSNKEYWGQVAVGSTVKSLRMLSFTQFPVLLPPLSKQKAIVHVLKTLDDKIEHNQKVSETLEETAKAIFQSWFVDFAPVRAKMEGRPTGLSPDISALFPKKLTQSKIGEIPQGWNIQALGEHIDIAKGRTYKSAELRPSNIALVTLKSFLRGGGYRQDGLKEYIGEYNPEQILAEGDVIFALTDLTQAADVLGRPAIVRESRVYDKLIASLDVGIIKIPEAKLVTKEFCYYLMLTRRYVGHAIGHASGTTVMHLSKDAPLRYKFCAPPKAIIKIFSKMAASIQQKILNAEKESATLSEIRDILLPKLISGNLKIADAKKLIKEAT